MERKTLIKLNSEETKRADEMLKFILDEIGGDVEVENVFNTGDNEIQFTITNLDKYE